jgi:hypothetical protein
MKNADSALHKSHMSFVNHDAIALTNSILAEIEETGESMKNMHGKLHK